MIRSCLALCLILTLTLSLRAADWPRFRGPNGTGVVDGPLPTINPKAPLWSVPIPGTKGVGSPIVVKGKIFLQTASVDGKTRTLICLDAATGKTLWTRDVPGTKVAKGGGGIHNKNTLASSTPASDGEMVYCTFWDGSTMGIRAYDLDGNEKWKQPIAAWSSEHGPAHSPAVYGDRVFVNFDRDGEAFVVAFDKKTGVKAWQKERAANRACYPTPFLLELPGQPVSLVVASTTGIDGYSPESGSVLWHYTIKWPSPDPKKQLRMIGAPVYTAGLLIGNTGNGGSDRYSLAIKPGGTGDVSATAKVWETRSNKATGPYVPSVLGKGDYLYWADENGFAGCTEAKTGKQEWYERVVGGGVTASPILVGDQMLVISERGEVALLKASREFALPDKLKLGEAVFATPALADGKLYIRTTGHLMCFGSGK